MKISDLINELFESKEMAEYLIEHSNELTKYNILKMVCSAPIDIRRKAEILLELSKDEDLSLEIAEEINCEEASESEYDNIKKCITEHSFQHNYECAIKAIDLLKADTGDVFSVQNLWYDKVWPKNYGEGDFHLSSSFENAMKYIEEDMNLDGWTWDNKDALSWYEIRKWSINENGDYQEKICYELIDGKLMFFSYDDAYCNEFEPDCNLNLITPFNTGDILTVDCRPQKPKRNILILENVTNYDCCSLQGLYYDPHKKLFSAHAVKHGSIYREFSVPYISPLYRITKTDKKLKEQEKIFNEIKTFLNNDTKKGEEMWLWIHNTEVGKEKQNFKGSDGVTAKELRKYMEEIANESN